MNIDFMKKGLELHLFNMKSIFLVISICFSAHSFGQKLYRELFGDSIKKIIWSCHVTYLPSGYSEEVDLIAKPFHFSAHHFETEIKRFYKRSKKRSLHISKREFVGIYQLYTSLTQSRMTISLSQADKDSLRTFLKEKAYNGALLHKLSLEQLEKHIEKDHVDIDKRTFDIDSLNDNLYGMVIDGAPFHFWLASISKNNDTTEIHYEGNLGGRDRFRDYSKFFLISILNRETELFKHFPMDNYFSKNELFYALLRYFEAKEGLLEFKPFKLILEEK